MTEDLVVSRLKKEVDRQFAGFQQLDHNGEETMKLIARPLVRDMCLLLIHNEQVEA